MVDGVLSVQWFTMMRKAGEQVGPRDQDDPDRLRDHLGRVQGWGPVC